ncbi:putative ribonuclease H-like domain-containing protein [Tanacetum coccineum]
MIAIVTSFETCRGALHSPKEQRDRHVRMGKVSGCLFLVLRVYGNMKITREAIEETIVLISRESFEHLIHEGKWKMVLSGSFIQLSIVNAYSPPCGEGSLLRIASRRRMSPSGVHICWINFPVKLDHSSMQERVGASSEKEENYCPELELKLEKKSKHRIIELDKVELGKLVVDCRRKTRRSDLVPATLEVLKLYCLIKLAATACERTLECGLGNPQMDLQDQRVIDSGCSRHMTGNMSYLTDYKEIDGGYVAFRSNPKGGKITSRVPRKNNMYSVDLKNIVPKGGLTCLFAKATSDESKLWHRRLGHINFKTMNKLVKGNLVRDDYSRFSWVFFLATKDETSGILKSFITGVENLIDQRVKVIRCDNETEFKNKERNQFCKRKVIKREFSVARTPQQNGVAKRKNRTLIKAARIMLADKSESWNLNGINDSED